MDTRKIQKSGDMHYLYLPTNWCKNNGIKNGSTVMVNQPWNSDLIVSPQLEEKKLKDIEISIFVDDVDVINKFLVACYINPLKSFKIHLEKNTDYSKLLEQKNLISLESVEFDNKKIQGQSSIIVADPDSLLKTMLMKIKNLLIIMTHTPDPMLINRYEEEIDRSKMLIDKAIIGALTNSHPSKHMKAIDLYYISWISRDLERMVDHLINLETEEKDFFRSVRKVIDSLKDILDDTESKKTRLTHSTIIEFIGTVKQIDDQKVKDVPTYDKRRVRDLLLNISEVLADWAVTLEIE